MAINYDEATGNSDSLVKLDYDKIKNVLDFKYFGVILTPGKPIRLIEHRISPTKKTRFCLRTRLSVVDCVIET